MSPPRSISASSFHSLSKTREIFPLQQLGNGSATHRVFPAIRGPSTFVPAPPLRRKPTFFHIVHTKKGSPPELRAFRFLHAQTLSRAFLPPEKPQIDPVFPFSCRRSFVPCVSCGARCLTQIPRFLFSFFSTVFPDCFDSGTYRSWRNEFVRSQVPDRRRAIRLFNLSPAIPP